MGCREAMEQRYDHALAEECQHEVNHTVSFLPARTASGTIKVKQGNDDPPHLPPLVAEKSILVCDD